MIKRRCQHVRALIEFAVGVCVYACTFRRKFAVIRPDAYQDPWIARQAEVVDCADVRIRLCGHLGPRDQALYDE